MFNYCITTMVFQLLIAVSSLDGCMRPSTELGYLDGHQGSPINRQFTSDGHARRTRHDGFSATLKCVRTDLCACWTLPGSAREDRTVKPR